MVASPLEFSLATGGIALLFGGAPDFPLAGSLARRVAATTSV
ncbi:hypothetical protein [Mycolicibacterium sp. A43C]